MATDSANPYDPMSEFEESLGLRPGFVMSLRHDDDWSFIIKAHALLEAGVTQLLAHALARPELVDVFGRLDMAATQFGKLAFAKTLRLIDDPGRRFIRTLGEVRNDFVHNVGFAECTLIDYFGRLDPHAMNAKHRALDLIFDDPLEDLTDGTGGKGPVTPRDMFRRKPKWFIAHGLTIALTPIHTRTAAAKHGSDWRHYAAQTVRVRTLGDLMLRKPDGA